MIPFVHSFLCANCDKQDNLPIAVELGIIFISGNPHYNQAHALIWKLTP